MVPPASIRRTHPLVPLAARPGVAAAVAESRAAVNRLLGHPALRHHTAEVAAEIALRAARASAHLDGVEVDLEVMRAVAGPVGARDAVPYGALRVSAELGVMAAVWRRAPLQALARLHLLAAADLVPPDLLGRPVVDPEGSARLAALAELAAGPPEVPALVEAAVVHGELLALGAFPAANGVVARAAARLVLITRGLDPHALTPVEVGHAAIASEYDAAATAYGTGGATGV